LRALYIVHDLEDAAVRRRSQALREAGWDVTMAGFVRGAASSSQPTYDAQSVVLGHTSDSRLVQRARAVFRRVAKPGELRGLAKAADVIIARNLECLVMGSRVCGSRPLIYECLDIHRTLLGNGAAERAIQAVEALLLPRVDYLLTSSPAFQREYFSRRPLKAPVLVLENRYRPPAGTAPPEPQPAPERNGIYTIGWFGMLRCRRSFEVLAALARRNEGKIEVIIAGKPSPAVFPDFEADLRANPALRYFGPYRPEQLASLYGRCHFAWCIDWFEEGLNSAWLLPNRLYESMAFGVVPIALDDVETGAWLRREGAGVLVSDASEVEGAIGGMDAAAYRAARAAVRQIDRCKLIAGEDEGRELSRMLGRLVAGRQHDGERRGSAR